MAGTRDAVSLLPPFARGLLAKRMAGLAPARHLVIACDWDVVRNARWRIVVPADQDPAEFDFRVVAGLEVIIFARDIERADAVGEAVKRFRPARLVGVIADAERACIRSYLPERRA